MDAMFSTLCLGFLAIGTTIALIFIALAPPKETAWKTRAVCGVCGWHTSAPGGSVFLAVGDRGCCPECGTSIGKWSGTPFILKVMRLENGKWVAKE